MYFQGMNEIKCQYHRQMSLEHLYVIPVSYTHLDVYKRQYICTHNMRLRIKEIKE